MEIREGRSRSANGESVRDGSSSGDGGSISDAAVGSGGIAPGAIGPAIAALGPGRRLVLVGVDRRRIAEALRTDGGASRCALVLAAADGRGAAGVLRNLLDDLAELALDRWPDWPDRDAPGTPWRRAASRLAAAGRPPRLRRAEVGMEFVELQRLVDPAGVILIAEVDPGAPRRAGAVIEALEWCAARGASVVALLSHRPPPTSPYDRLLYGARELSAEAEPDPVHARFIASSAEPHHASPTERRVKDALDRDAELGPLFASNQLVTDAGLRPPRVDLLWSHGRVVVELDGPEHQAGPKFGDDRHRDYELLVAGYHVLRITNDQVATDLQRAVEKIRAVVRLRRGERIVP